MNTVDLSPVVRTVPLRRPRDHAFRAFVEQVARWWPPAFTASGDDLADVVIEGRDGGRIYETGTTGDEYDWGAVTTWEPGRRVVASWTLGLRGGSPTELEVSFDGDGDTCDVRLEHRGWQADQGTARARFADGGGWNVVLDAYRVYAEG